MFAKLSLPSQAGVVDAGPSLESTSTRLFLGFLAGFLSHLFFQGGFGAILYAVHLLPALPWSLMPVPPFGVPRSLNLGFWAGLWGLGYAWLEPRLTSRFGRWPGGLIYGLAPLLVYWFAVLPLKGSGIGGGFHLAKVPIEVGFHAAFGIGAAIIFRSGLVLARRRASALKLLFVLVLAPAIALSIVAAVPRAAAGPDDESSPIFGVKIPAGYRAWALISVAREEGKLDDLRAILGNDVAIKAAREGKLPFPDGTIIARLAWSHDPLPESKEAFGQAQSFVAGAAKNGVQFMVKDSRKYASTGGWGFAQFDAGKPADESMHNTCFACHEIVKARDFVFNRYAP